MRAKKRLMMLSTDMICRVPGSMRGYGKLMYTHKTETKTQERCSPKLQMMSSDSSSTSKIRGLSDPKNRRFHSVISSTNAVQEQHTY